MSSFLLNEYVMLCYVYAFPGEKQTSRDCVLRGVIGFERGCGDVTDMEGYIHFTGRACVCEANLCNAATMTSSLGHVIVTAVALFITARLM